jgi:hypothetical protein
MNGSRGSRYVAQLRALGARTSAAEARIVELERELGDFVVDCYGIASHRELTPNELRHARRMIDLLKSSRPPSPVDLLIDPFPFL